MANWQTNSLSGIWVPDTALTRPIKLNGDILSVRVAKWWVDQHRDWPIEVGSIVVVGNVPAAGQLKHLVAIKVTRIDPTSRVDLVFNGTQILNVPKNLH